MQTIPSHCALFFSLVLATLAASAGPLTGRNSSASELDAQNGIPAIHNQREAVSPPSTSGDQTLSQEAVERQQHSGFAEYAQRVSGTRLQVFGSELFQHRPSGFTPQENAQVNGDYLLGPGDALQIRGWGMVDIDWNVTVERDGSIYIPRVGTIRIAGVRFKDLPAHLKQALGRVFTNFELSVSIALTHALHIYVVGHAVRPGSYTMSAMSTLLNALFHSGGPSGSGSMRTISLMRNGKEVSNFDLYDMLIHGDKSRDISLQDGDVIHIPAVGPQIALTGALKRPGIYELKGKTDMDRALHWAGGFTPGAQGQQIIIEKDIGHQFQAIAKLGDPGQHQHPDLNSIFLSSADVIRIVSPGSIALESAPQSRFVQVAGEVTRPGIHQIRDGETLRELIQRLGGITAEGYLFAMRMERESVRRQQQEMLNTLAERYSREIEALAPRKSAGISDQGIVNAQKAELERMQQLAKKMQSAKADGRIVLELASASVTTGHLPPLPLQDGDRIFIPKRPGTVSVLGAVFQANTFIYHDQRNAADYLALAGGPSQTASQADLYVIRADGTVRSGRNGILGLTHTRINPGDAIVVPEKIERSHWVQSLKDWTSILYQFGLGVAGIRILRN
jgi:polysaccharide export outer membrane protein